MKKIVLFLFLFAMAPIVISGCSKKESANKIGVAECDDFLTKLDKCLEKAPQEARGPLKANIDQMTSQWKSLAATPEGKSGLAMGCKAALDTVKQTTAGYGCEW